MKKAVFLFALIKSFLIYNSVEIKSLLKCKNTGDNIKLSKGGFSSDTFSFSTWIRVDFFKNVPEKFDFLSFKSSSGDLIILQAQIFGDGYNIFYLENLIGTLKFKDLTFGAFIEDDFQQRKFLFQNWRFFGFSKTPTEIIFFIDNLITINISTNFLSDNTIFNNCLAIDNNNPFGIYYAHNNILPSQIGTTAFDILKLKPNGVLGFFYFSNVTKKTNFFIPNSIKNNKVSYLKIHVNRPEFPYSKWKTDYIFCHAKKLLSFEYKDYSVIDNSYIITIKLTLEKLFGVEPEFILYGRYNKLLNPLDNNFTPDKINYLLSFLNPLQTNRGILTLKTSLDINSTPIDNQEFTFDYMTSIIFYLRIENGIDYNILNAKKNKIIMGFISDNHYFKVAYPNFDSFSFDDKHIFGFSTTMTSSIFYINMYDYIISKGRDFIYDSVNEKIILEQDCIITKTPFKQKRLELDSKTLILNSSDAITSDFCGIPNCQNCDITSSICTDCSNTYILQTTNLCSTNTCTSTLEFNYYSYQCTNYSTIPITFNSFFSVSSTTLDDINTNIFDRMTNEGLDFIINIYFSRRQAGALFTFTESKTFATKIDKYLNTNSFLNYFQLFPDLEFCEYQLSYKIDTNDYSNIKIYGFCTNPLDYYEVLTNTCSPNCQTGFYPDENNICLQCDDNCVNCDENNCLTCENDFNILDGMCISPITCENTIENCEVCDLGFSCTSCGNGFLLQGGVCVFFDGDRCLDLVSNCLSCDSIDNTKCKICKNLFFLNNNICKVYCLNIDFADSCRFDDFSKIETCHNGYILDSENNICQEKCKDSVFFEDICVPNFCFEIFCNQCEDNFINGCEICLDCFNLGFYYGISVKCSEIVRNCEYCFIKKGNDIKCQRCQTDFFLFLESCEKSQEIELKLNNEKIYESTDFGIVFKCISGYFYEIDRDRCFEINYDCNIGCAECYDIEKICLKCVNNFTLNIENNNCDGIPKNISLLPDIIKNLFEEENKNLNCENLINNVTIFEITNNTIYLNSKDFKVDKEIDYRRNISEINNSLEDCILINENKINLVIKNITNSKFFFDKDFCKKKNSIILNCKKEIQCKNDDCSHYIKNKECNQIINNEICKNFYKNIVSIKDDTSNKTINEKTISNYEYCQRGTSYYFAWINSCKKECKFIINPENKLELINKYNNTKVKFDLKTLEMSTDFLTDGIKMELNNKGESLKFIFDNWKPKYKFILKPKFILFARDCSFRTNVEFSFKNNKVILPNYIKTLTGNSNTITFSALSLIGFCFPFLLSGSFLEILQFNQFFAYLYFLDIKGGTFYNFMSSLNQKKPDSDVRFIKKELYYEYQNSTIGLKKTRISSIFNVYLTCLLIIITMVKYFVIFFQIKLDLILIKMLKNKKQNLKVKFLPWYKRYLIKLKVLFIAFDYKKLYDFFYMLVWKINILKCPQIILLFTKKYYYFTTTNKVLICFYIIFFISFFGHLIIEQLFFLNDKSKSLHPNLLIFKNKYHMDANLTLVRQQVIFMIIIFFQIFLIYFCTHHILCLIIIIILGFFEIFLFIYFWNKKIKVITITKILSQLFFNIWIMFVLFEKVLDFYAPITLNVFYVLSNVVKFSEVFIEKKVISKIKKKIILDS